MKSLGNKEVAPTPPPKAEQKKKRAQRKTGHPLPVKEAVGIGNSSVRSFSS